MKLSKWLLIPCLFLMGCLSSRIPADQTGYKTDRIWVEAFISDGDSIKRLEVFCVPTDILLRHNIDTLIIEFVWPGEFKPISTIKLR